ncbi:MULTISPECIES: hypothetical protein [Acetobacteraceae]|jgi:hypothetical protein|uniref:Cytochrome c family protein n=3 Tax=Acetobacteraceae TaxID=433 RepID=A0AB35AQA1_GLUOY|nr:MULTISPECIES: hypothetical protein [Acetobacteraceae]KXV28965.1 cytochrome c family protein [Gluconobacter japonicus]MBF0857058.1 cytochrome c family protein [Gluconobacter oxydans]PYD80324.1 cytochrome c family protein [Komagataeibacter oboediens]TCW22953.1 hypothetical protein EDC20_13011 [Gluconobacter oxydans]WKE49548.1 cytochrome c family protein [Gluconobacter oxydans]
MKPVVLLYTIFAAAALIVGVAVPLTMHHSGSNAIPGWEGLVSPGPVSKAHQFIASQCETCHKPFSGVVSNNCVTCHSLASFADKQSTRFHVAATQCTSCHVEHGERPHMTMMDHGALTRTEFWSDTVAKLQAVGIVGASSMPVGHLPVGNSAQRLNCASCHSNVDPHRARFGPDCATCHATNTWLISSFEHPADQTSTDCNECHKAPPSHYMMHFKMISQHVAHQDAPVEHCYACHTTDAWNNIRGYGWYKHH